MFTYATQIMDYSLPPSSPMRLPSSKYPLFYLPSSTSGGGSEEGIVLEKRDVGMSNIPNRVSNVPGYKGGRLPI